MTTKQQFYCKICGRITIHVGDSGKEYCCMECLPGTSLLGDPDD